MAIRVVFMGSPDFALPSLQALAAGYEVAGIVTQPDRPAGRGRGLTPPPVKSLAQQLKLPFIQPRRLSEPDAVEQLRAWSPDLIVVVAFGQILKAEVLGLAPLGSLNVHASLLPRWRGAAPIHAAVLHGDAETGVSIMQMDEGLDTGPVLSQESTPISAEDTSGSLGERLSKLGAELLIRTLPAYIAGSLSPQAQDEALATHAPMLKKRDGELDFSLEAEQLARQVRAYHPWPGSFTYWQGELLKVHRAYAVEATASIPGQTAIHAGRPAIAAQKGLLVLEELQPAGKKAMSGEVFLRGARNWEATSLTT